MTPEEQYADSQFNLFYGPAWLTRDTNLDQYQFSGWTLGEKVNIMERVIHIDCGNNPFHNMIPNLIGVDPYNSKADYVMTTEQFAYSHKAQQFNVAFLLGAVNFGTQAEIQAKISLVISMLRKRDARIYFRCYTVPPEGAPANFFSWSYDLQMYFANLFNFSIVDMEAEADNSIYAEWWSNNRSMW